MAVNLLATTLGALNWLTFAYNWQITSLAGNFHVHLFVNSYTVVAGTTLGAMTEAAWPGYSVGNPSWSAPATVGGIPQTVSSTVTFTQTSAFPSTNYGLFVTDSTNTQLMGACNFTSPVVLTASQPSYALTVTLTGKSEF